MNVGIEEEKGIKRGEETRTVERLDGNSRSRRGRRGIWWLKVTVMKVEEAAV